MERLPHKQLKSTKNEIFFKDTWNAFYNISFRAVETEFKRRIIKMKKTISLAMAAALAISGAVTTVPVFADDVTNITIWSPTDREAIEAWWKDKIAEWNKDHPEIQVSREAIDRSDSYAYDNKIATAVTSNDLPDIFYVDGPQVSYYAANGITVPLDDYLQMRIKQIS